ncbi:hypothetical protein [Tenacibaculum sp. A30]|uniref:hypothetical protein n=1 Tax=Tenacibaculum sp. A30 TaxID=3442644 RepID=UPI003EB7BD8D
MEYLIQELGILALLVFCGRIERWQKPKVLKYAVDQYETQRFGALRRRGLESTNFQFSTNVAKPFLVAVAVCLLFV